MGRCYKCSGVTAHSLWPSVLLHNIHPAVHFSFFFLSMVKWLDRMEGNDEGNIIHTHMGKAVRCTGSIVILALEWITEDSTMALCENLFTNVLGFYPEATCRSACMLFVSCDYFSDQLTKKQSYI